MYDGPLCRGGTLQFPPLFGRVRQSRLFDTPRSLARSNSLNRRPLFYAGRVSPFPVVVFLTFEHLVYDTVTHKIAKSDITIKPQPSMQLRSTLNPFPKRARKDTKHTLTNIYILPLLLLRGHALLRIIIVEIYVTFLGETSE